MVGEVAGEGQGDDQQSAKEGVSVIPASKLKKRGISCRVTENLLFFANQKQEFLEILCAKLKSKKNIS